MDSVKLGSDVAEHEHELSDLFVTDNEAYRRLIRDEVDLVAGGKGTGKSAIYRMITETVRGSQARVTGWSTRIAACACTPPSASSAPEFGELLGKGSALVVPGPGGGRTQR
jgi:hypothetical protein